MKQNYILLLIFSLFLFSCDNDDQVVIETSLPPLPRDFIAWLNYRLKKE